MTLQLPPSRSGRRTFLKRLAGAGALTLIGSSTGPFGRPLQAWALPGDGDDTVVVNVFLRGGADGLNIIAPVGDPSYLALRPSLGLTAGSYTDLDGFFGLNNHFSPLHDRYLDGTLAIVHAAGSTDTTRSHFDAMPNMDTGFSSTGWLQRALGIGQFDPVLSGLSIGPRVSPPMAGPFSGSVISTLEETASNGMSLAVARPAIEEMYAAPRYLLEQVTVANALESLDEFSVVPPGDPRAYPSSSLAVQFREAAAVIRSDIGVRGIAIDYGGWDTHASQAPRMETLGGTLAGALSAFQQDLQGDASRVVVVVMTEFGRTARENGSGGTDHGHGNFMMVMGEPLVGVGGGQVHLAGGIDAWPGLSPAQLNENRDLRITTDFRSVLSEVLDRHLGVDPSGVFANFTPTYTGLLGALLPGDADRSGVVNNVDSELVLNDLAGNPLAGYFRTGGDIDDDGDTDLRDALLIAREAGN